MKNPGGVWRGPFTESDEAYWAVLGPIVISTKPVESFLEPRRGGLQWPPGIKDGKMDSFGMYHLVAIVGD
jgi:hypothetical protein